MDILLIIFAGIAVLAGIAGSFLPFLPGPPLSWLGLLLLQFSSRIDFSAGFLIATALVTILITVLDYLLPVWTVRRSGGTRSGQKGAVAGMLIGLFAGPVGIILGPLAGAFIGELLGNGFNWSRAKTAAWNSFLGFLISTGIQLGWCLIILFWYVKALI